MNLIIMSTFEENMDKCDCCDNTIHLWVYIIMLTIMTSAFCWHVIRRLCKNVRDMADPEIVHIIRH